MLARRTRRLTLPVMSVMLLTPVAVIAQGALTPAAAKLDDGHASYSLDGGGGGYGGDYGGYSGGDYGGSLGGDSTGYTGPTDLVVAVADGRGGSINGSYNSDGTTTDAGRGGNINGHYYSDGAPVGTSGAGSSVSDSNDGRGGSINGYYDSDGTPTDRVVEVAGGTSSTYYPGGEVETTNAPGRPTTSETSIYPAPGGTSGAEPGALTRAIDVLTRWQYQDVDHGPAPTSGGSPDRFHLTRGLVPDCTGCADSIRDGLVENGFVRRDYEVAADGSSVEVWRAQNTQSGEPDDPIRINVDVRLTVDAAAQTDTQQRVEQIPGRPPLSPTRLMEEGGPYSDGLETLERNREGSRPTGGRRGR